MKEKGMWLISFLAAVLAVLVFVVPVDAADAAIYPGDTLRLTVLGEADYTRQILVDAAGKIALPLVGEINVGGKTTGQATADITEALKKYLKNPQVTLEVAVPAKRNAAISGAVKNAGLYPIAATTRLVDLLSLAGGQLQNADLTKITVTRAESKETVTCNLQEFYAGRNPEGNVMLVDGDSVMVPELGIVLVMGQVRTPGPVQMTSSMTVRQAVERAGGTTELADATKAILKKSGSNQSVNIDLVKALQGDQSADLTLAEGDEIDIPALTQLGKFTVTTGVNNPGQYPITGQMYVTEAISLAGGVNQRGKLQNVIILRGSQSIKVNLNDVYAGKSQNVAVLPGDNISVAEGREKPDVLRTIGTAASVFWMIFKR